MIAIGAQRTTNVDTYVGSRVVSNVIPSFQDHGPHHRLARTQEGLYAPGTLLTEGG